MISVTILTKNCAETLEATLKSVQRFDQVVIFDTGSTDKTLEIARPFPNVVIYERPFHGFGETHNEASSLAKHDWILSLDSDEVLSDCAAQEILQLTLNKNCCYALLRDNFLNGKHVKWASGWYPDWVVRLYHRKSTQFSSDAVHEKIMTDRLAVQKLKHTIRHTPYRSIADFLTKMQTYSTLFAEQNKGKKRSSLLHALSHSAYAFIKSYLFKRGFLGGAEGFLISKYNAQVTFYKYLKLAELNK